MPNLRKRSSVLTYNDDAIYRAIENQRKVARSTEANVLKLPNVLQNKEKIKYVGQGANKIPEFVFASDGRKFFPCLFCCHAFALKKLQIEHMKQCTFRVSEISEPPVISSNKVEQLSKPKPSHSPIRKTNTNQPNKTLNKTHQFKLNPKLTVQKSKPKHFGLNAVMNDSAIKIVKRQPSKSAFPKIKLEPITASQKISNMQPRAIDENKFIKNTNIQPQLGNEIHKLTKNVKQTSGNICLHCNIFFSSRASLVQHKRDKHIFPKIFVPADKVQEYDEMYKNSDMSKCTICFKPVPKVRWSRHLQTHITEKKYFCSVCKKTFGRKDHLNVHERTHMIDMVNPFIQALGHFIDG